MNQNTLSKPSQIAEPAGRRSHLQEWTDNLNVAIKDNAALSQQLEERLRSISRAAAPVAACRSNQVVPQEYLVEMADGLRVSVQSIETTNLALRDLLSRIEV